MNSISYIIPAIPPSMNKYKGRTNMWEYHKDKAKWEEMIGFICRPRPSAPIKQSVLTLTYYFKTKIRHDPNNYDGQFITDGLVKAKIIVDDSFDNIELVLRGRHDKDNPRTEIHITPREGANA